MNAQKYTQKSLEAIQGAQSLAIEHANQQIEQGHLLLALLRKIVLLIPLIYILPLFFGDKLFGVFVAEPIADILAAATTTVCFLVFAKKNLGNKPGASN